MESFDLLHRKWIERALELLQPARSRTSLLLYKEPPFQGVSLEENVLLVLLLFRKKQKETMIEGKKLLSHLLGFQNKDKGAEDFGSFPVDITEFPQCNDRTLGARIAFFLEIIVKDFGLVLGKELSEKIAEANQLLFSYIKRNWEEVSWGEVERLYVELLLPEVERKTRNSLPDPSSLGKMVAATDYFPDYPLKKKLLEQAVLFWDEKSHKYCGPACGLYQQGAQPVCTLLDCWMGLHVKHEPSCSWTRTTALDVALLQTTDAVISCQKKNIENEAYALFHFSQGSLAAVFQTPRPHLLQGFSPLRLVIENSVFTWHFPRGRLVSLKQDEERFLGVVEREEHSTLFEMCVERLPEVSFFRGTKASLFDPVKGYEVHVGKSILRICLSPFAGESVGLLCMGNRRNQLMDVREDAYDWMVACDQIRGEDLKQFSFSIETRVATYLVPEATRLVD